MEATKIQLFKKTTIKMINAANESEVLHNTFLRMNLKKFVKVCHGGSNIKAPIEEIIECFELCDGLLTGPENFFKRRSDLEELCFTEGWEIIMKAPNNNTLRELMQECVRRLGEEPEYHFFKSTWDDFKIQVTNQLFNLIQFHQIQFFFYQIFIPNVTSYANHSFIS